MCKTMLLLCVMLCSACATDELYDPTGTWAMSFRWNPGGCQATGSVARSILVVQSGEEFLVATGKAGETTTGGIRRSTSDAELSVTITNRDVLNDGGSVTSTVTIDATADDASAISGFGSVNLSGATICSQSFAISGSLQ
jgi:hypothetical protein